MVESAQQGTIVPLRQCLESPNYVQVAAGVILTNSSICSELLNMAFKKAEAFPEQLETWCLRGELPIENLECAFSSENMATAIAAAVGEWIAAKHDKRSLHSPDAWRKAILLSATPIGCNIPHNTHHWLADIFKEDSAVAFEWLVKLYAISCDYHDYEISKLAKKALKALLPDQRLMLLNRVDRAAAAHVAIRTLIGNDETVYTALLARGDLENVHLRPLEGAPSPEWRAKAIAALNAGYTKARVFAATRLTSWEWTGNLSDMWKERKKAFEEFRADPDLRIASIACDAMEDMDRRISEQLEKEREEAIHGRERRRM